ncbi:hypothetical protein MVEN_00033000 [Mycena venus]|uniref:Uncharacterized protein n=1 Tax=Mycena venus TaxID=2733690 RepID=A0A8H6Z708_9AGAR|nr:hypothetical protein MVEN_00033000 [Mycena venus]
MKTEDLTEEQKAQAFLNDMDDMESGDLDRDKQEQLTMTRYRLRSLTRLFASLGADPELSPDTPKTQIRRRVRHIVAERESYISGRALTAKQLEVALQDSLIPVYKFLRGARELDHELEMPVPEKFLLRDLDAVRRAIDNVEDMVKAMVDMAETDKEDPDVTLVASSHK